MSGLLKLNLGCGKSHIEGFLNVDKFGEPDLVHDLEVFPWPWKDTSVSEVVMNHVLEHLGRDTDTYFSIIKELYRICAPGAVVHIAVPHPRHNDFINDPTHIRVVTAEGLSLFSKRKNRENIAHGYADTPLALYLDVDFEVEKMMMTLDPFWLQKYDKREISEAELHHAVRAYNNVVKEIRVVMRVMKESA